MIAKVESAEKEEANGSVKSGYYASAQYVKDSKKFRRYKLKTVFLWENHKTLINCCREKLMKIAKILFGPQEWDSGTLFICSQKLFWK